MSSVVHSSSRKSRKRAHQLTPEERFQRQWDRVQRLKTENGKLAEEVAQVAARIRDVIEAEEVAYLGVLYEQCERLIRFVSRKTLPEYLREELVAWIEDDIDEIRCNPFARHLNVMALYESLLLELDEHFDNEKTRLQAKYGGMNGEVEHESDDDDTGPQPENRDTKAQPGGQNTQDMFEDLFEEFAQAEDPEEEALHDDRQEGFEGDYEEQGRAHAEQYKEQQAALDQLLKSSSINRLFRQVARAIHPDRARDDEERAKKHELMTRLTSARDRKDILTIFAMYAEHVGEPPASVLSGDLDKIMQLLSYQEQLIKAEREAIIHADPAQGVLYEHFASRTSAQLEKKLHDHCRVLAHKTESREWICEELTSVARLKPFLQERIAVRHDQMIEELMGRQVR